MDFTRFHVHLESNVLNQFHMRALENGRKQNIVPCIQTRADLHTKCSKIYFTLTHPVLDIYDIQTLKRFQYNLRKGARNFMN